MMENTAYLHAMFIGGPKTITDEQGTYRSSIWRDRVHGPVELEKRGLVGDQVTNSYHHGKPGQAVCCHFMEHYRFWNANYGMELEAGNVGENWALEHILEEEVCIGDIYRVGTARVQVSAPRAPCGTQARRVGRADWVKLTVQEMRTGIYMRVLEPGIVEEGDKLELVARPHPEGSIKALNRCHYHDFDPQVARRFADMPELMAYWRKSMAKRLEA